jgi:hypothetical protein
MLSRRRGHDAKDADSWVHATRRAAAHGIRVGLSRLSPCLSLSLRLLGSVRRLGLNSCMDCLCRRVRLLNGWVSL